MQGLASERSPDSSSVVAGWNQSTGVQERRHGHMNWLESTEVLSWLLQFTQRWRIKVSSESEVERRVWKFEEKVCYKKARPGTTEHGDWAEVPRDSWSCTEVRPVGEIVSTQRGGELGLNELPFGQISERSEDGTVSQQYTWSAYDQWPWDPN